MTSLFKLSPTIECVFHGILKMIYEEVGKAYNIVHNRHDEITLVISPNARDKIYVTITDKIIAVQSESPTSCQIYYNDISKNISREVFELAHARSIVDAVKFVSTSFKEIQLTMKRHENIALDIYYSISRELYRPLLRKYSGRWINDVFIPSFTIHPADHDFNYGYMVNWESFLAYSDFGIISSYLTTQEKMSIPYFNCKVNPKSIEVFRSGFPQAKFNIDTFKIQRIPNMVKKWSNIVIRNLKLQ